VPTVRLLARRGRRRCGSLAAAAISVAAPAAAAAGQSAALGPRQPVIDVHVHSTMTTPAMLQRLEALGVRYIVLSALAADLPLWAAVDSSRYVPALVFPCPGGRAVITGRPCFANGEELPDTTWLREEVRAGRVRAFSELVPQFLGLSPADPRLEPYWSLAEEFDLPVGIHLGPGPPGVAYDESPVPRKAPAFRMALGDPLLLEEVLLRHQRLRVVVMHAGWPRLESMLALLYAHPNVYVEVGGLQSTRIVPRAEYLRYLRGLVEAGFGRRIMFGSDFADQVDAGIEAIRTADFLTEETKADILCRNAARFLRLGGAACEP
jgi:hypothetical protein